MSTYLLATSATTQEKTFRTTAIAQADAGLAGVLDLLAAAGLTAEAVFDGDAEGCPHCASRVLPEAA